MAQDLNQEEVLIARNNETGQVGAVTGLNEDGTPKMTDVKSAKLTDLVKFSKGQNPLEAFMSNFVRQCKNPSVFGFFKVPADRYDSVGMAMADFAKAPDANAEILKDFKVDVPQQEQKQAETPEQKPAAESQTEQSESKFKAVDESKVDWQMLKEKWGIDRDALEASGDLREMLYNRKSKLVNVTPTFGGEKFNIEARLSFRTDPDGSVKLVPHFIQSEQKIDQFMGYKFSKIDQANLKENGNLGRIVELTDPATGEKVPSLISRDRYTNELLAIPAKDVRIRDTFGQTKLTMPEILTLKKGIPLPPKRSYAETERPEQVYYSTMLTEKLSSLYPTASTGMKRWNRQSRPPKPRRKGKAKPFRPAPLNRRPKGSPTGHSKTAVSSLSDSGTKFLSLNSRRMTTPTDVSPNSTTWSMRRVSPAPSIYTSTRRNSVP